MKVTTRNTNSAVAVLDLHGQLTLTSDSEPLDQTLQDLIRLRVTRILLNLSDITLLDCSGVGHLLRARAQVAQSGGILALCGLNYRVRSIFELFDLGQVLRTFESDATAVASFFRQHSQDDKTPIEGASDRKIPRPQQHFQHLWRIDSHLTQSNEIFRSEVNRRGLSSTMTSQKASLKRV